MTPQWLDRAAADRKHSQDSDDTSARPLSRGPTLTAGTDICILPRQQPKQRGAAHLFGREDQQVSRETRKKKTGRDPEEEQFIIWAEHSEPEHK